MIRALALLLLVLSGCAADQSPIRSIVNCANADKARTALTVAYQALDRACPIPVEIAQ